MNAKIQEVKPGPVLCNQSVLFVFTSEVNAISATIAGQRNSEKNASMRLDTGAKSLMARIIA